PTNAPSPTLRAQTAPAGAARAARVMIMPTPTSPSRSFAPRRRSWALCGLAVLLPETGLERRAQLPALACVLAALRCSRTAVRSAPLLAENPALVPSLPRQPGTRSRGARRNRAMRAGVLKSLALVLSAPPARRRRGEAQQQAVGAVDLRGGLGQQRLERRLVVLDRSRVGGVERRATQQHVRERHLARMLQHRRHLERLGSPLRCALRFFALHVEPRRPVE